MTNVFFQRRAILAASTGVLLALAFPPVPTGTTAFIAFVPLLFALDGVDRLAHAARLSYLAFFLLNLLTIYWAGGFTHGRDVYLMIAGALLLLAHPFFFVIPVLAFLAVRRAFGIRTALLGFPFIWVGFEYAHSSTEISFPWLSLANTQTYDPAAIQFTSITGSYGITFWVVAVNCLLYFAALELSAGSARSGGRRPMFLLLAAILLVLLPRAITPFLRERSNLAPGNAQESQIRLAVIQPNVDPFQKWEGSPDRSVDTLLALTRAAAQSHPDLILWPETAVPFYLPIPQPALAPGYGVIKRTVDSLQIPLLTGAAEFVYLNNGDRIPRTSKKDADGRPYETYNAAYLITPGASEVQHYEKMRLVPFAERVPFSEALSFLNAMQWNFGLGGWGIGNDTAVFQARARDGRLVRCSPLVCYESIYPGFTAAFVRKGAEFLVVITNDSWWGNTSGVYQHKQAAVLRAIENHRWIVQCANGGISFAVDPDGQFHETSRFSIQEVLVAGIAPESDLTFYTKHGDWFAGAISIIALAIVVPALFIDLRQLKLRRNPRANN